MSEEILYTKEYKVERFRKMNETVQKGQVLCAGSSLMEMFPIEKFVAEAKLPITIYNRGVGGFVTRELIENIDTCILDLAPSRIFLNIGTNDLSNPDITIDAIMQQYEQLLQKIEAALPEAELYLMAYYPINYDAAAPEMKQCLLVRTNEKIKEANQAVQKLAAAHHARYIDINAPLKDNQGNLRAEYTIEGMHINEDGYRAVFPEFLKFAQEKPWKVCNNGHSCVSEHQTSEPIGSTPFVPENPANMPVDSAPFVPENPTSMPTNAEPDSTTVTLSFKQEAWYQTLLKNAQMSLGNNKRLKTLIKRAQAGEEITVASIGGSITEGAGAAKYKECYAYRTYEQFKNAYGAGDGFNVHFVNAGVGGTPSTFGIMRYQRDIVDRVQDADGLPDLVLLEYAVNDYQEPTKHGCYESLVKDILRAPNHPVVILVFAVFPDGFTLQDEYKKVGTTYDLMMVSTKNAVFPYIGDKWSSQEFFFDIYHPTTLGHGVMADCIFGAIKAAAEKEPDAEDINLEVEPAYSTAYTGMHTIFKDSHAPELKLSLGSFCEDDEKAYRNLPIGAVYDKNFHHTAESGSEALTFEGSFKNLLLAFRSVNDADYGQIEVLIDGKQVRIINGNTGSWGQSVTELIMDNPEAEPHKVAIRMAEGDENKKFTITCMGYTD